MEEAASLAHYKAVKNKLPNIAVKSDTLDKLKNVVAAVNEIVIHGTQFLKLYLLHHYDQNDGNQTWASYCLRSKYWYWFFEILPIFPIPYFKTGNNFILTQYQY